MDTATAGIKGISTVSAINAVNPENSHSTSTSACRRCSQNTDGEEGAARLGQPPLEEWEHPRGGPVSDVLNTLSLNMVLIQSDTKATTPSQRGPSLGL